MSCTLHAATLVGVDAVPVEVEVHATGGAIPGFHLVGLPDSAVREGSVRIRAALNSTGYEIGCSRITVNLAPADLRKDGSAFDLPIALGSVCAKKLAENRRPQLLLAGELALDGRLRPIRGALSLAQLARKQGREGVVVPAENGPEAALVEGVAAYGVSDLDQAVALLEGRCELAPARPPDPSRACEARVDFSDLCGQRSARRAAEVAAAGGHNLMLIGPPGSGKTMLARRLAGVLPPMSSDEAVEATKVHSAAGLLRERGGGLLTERPFRAPHHTCSAAGLIGGGSLPRPGEVSLAHNGVLFIDEIPELSRQTLEALRQPIEDGRVAIVRARGTVVFPSRFMLVAAMNPCPCGYRGSLVRTCICGERQALRYASRISGPLLDRFDLFVRVEPVPTEQLLAAQHGESTAEIRARVDRARARQRERFRKARIHCNAQMSSRQLRRYVPLSGGCREQLESYAELHMLSARALHRACRVARTIADLRGDDRVDESHIGEALNLQLERWV